MLCRFDLRIAAGLEPERSYGVDARTSGLAPKASLTGRWAARRTKTFATSIQATILIRAARFIALYIHNPRLSAGLHWPPATPLQRVLARQTNAPHPPALLHAHVR